MKTSNNEEETSKPNKVNELYMMYQTNKKTQQSMSAKGEEDREKKEMSYCTFNPKITELNRDMFYQDINSFDESNDLYIKRMKKTRDEKMLQDRKRKIIADKRSRITIPKEFKMNNGTKMITTNHNNKINALLRYNMDKGIRIDRKMNYNDAVKLLHNELLNTNKITNEEL